MSNFFALRSLNLLLTLFEELEVKKSRTAWELQKNISKIKEGSICHHLLVSKEKGLVFSSSVIIWNTIFKIHFEVIGWGRDKKNIPSMPGVEGSLQISKSWNGLTDLGQGPTSDFFWDCLLDSGDFAKGIEVSLKTQHRTEGCQSCSFKTTDRSSLAEEL